MASSEFDSKQKIDIYGLLSVCILYTKSRNDKNNVSGIT